MDRSCNISVFLVCYGHGLRRINSEVFQFRDWTRRHDGNRIANLHGIAGVVHEILLGAYEVLLIFRILHVTVNADRGGILHRRLYDDADERLRANSFCSILLCNL